MSDLTPAQAGELDLLIDQHGQGKLEAGPDGTMIFTVADRTWQVSPAGEVSDYDLPDDGAHVACQAAGSDGRTSEPETSAGESTSDEAGSTPGAQDDPGPDPSAGPGVPVPTVEHLPQSERPAAFEAMTLADERQVVQDLEGNALQSMVYGFRAGGKMVYGLSWIGAREAVRNFNARTSSQIRVSDATPPQFEDVTIKAEVGRGEDGPLMEEVPAIRCTVYAEDAALGGGQWGTATVAREQINKKKLKDGRYLTNPDGFAAAKALSKAQRNALEPLIPRWLIEELIAQFKGNGQVEYLEGTGKQVVKELPPALTDDRAKAQTDRCRELYAEWSKHGGKKTMPPAQFNNAMTACQHSHERLDDFIAHLESKLNEARGE